MQRAPKSATMQETHEGTHNNLEGDCMALGTKIGIIGCNHVGAHVANAILYQGIASELHICDLDEVLSRAQVNDLNDAAAFYPHTAVCYDHGCRYEELADCDIIVNAAGHVAEAARSRDGELFVTTEEAKKFAKRVVDAGFKGIWVSVANPNDVIASALQGLTGYDPMKIIGAGTTLDSARLRHALWRATGIAQESINAWMLGEHGFSEFACWSHVTFGILTLDEIQKQLDLKLDLADLEQQAVKGGYVTYVAKQCTEYSIANSTTEIVKAVAYNTHAILPVSTAIDGIYGVSGIYSSIPCMVGAAGVERQLMPELTEYEQERWHQTCDHIADNLAKVRCW